MKITLKEYALLHKRNPATVRQKAIRGGFKTAEKIGRDWFIDKEEPYSDLRKKDKNSIKNIDNTTLK